MNTKHSSIPVIKKKKNPIPAEIRTKLLTKLWRDPWRKASSYFCMRKLGEAEISTSKGKGKWAGSRWVVLVCTALLPTQEREKEAQRSVGLSLSIIFKISTLVKANSVYVMLPFPAPQNFHFLEPPELKCCSVQIASLPWAALPPPELRQTLSIQCGFRKPGVTNKDKDSFFTSSYFYYYYYFKLQSAKHISS